MIATPPIVPPPAPLLNNEDAVAVANDFFHTLDNLGSEVEFILKEIHHKDSRIKDLQDRLHQRTANILRSARNSSSSNTLNPPSQRDLTSIPKITEEHNRIEALQNEKIALAERLVSIVNRHKERGREEYRKIAGDEAVEALVKEEEGWDLSSTEGIKALVNSRVVEGSGAGLGIGGMVMGALGGQRGAMMPGMTPINTGMDDRMIKKRKANGLSGNITPGYNDMPPPSAPAFSLPHGHGHVHSTAYISPAQSLTPVGGGRSAGAGVVSTKRRGQSQISEDVEMEMEMELEPEGEPMDGADDDSLYCFCQEKSYGEMIGCDNDECRFEWFHLKCVKVEPPLPETWFCPECVKMLNFEDSQGTPKQKPKGRKK